MAKRDVIDVLIAEALGEGDKGMAAVAWTILNRAAETGRTPAQVIADPGDYTGASNPGPAAKRAMKDPNVRARVERVWSQVQSGSIPDPTGGATHYWAPKGMKGGKAPYWADEEQSAAGRLKIGNHIFLPKQTPNSALAAINAVAPTPMPSRPVALGYSQSTGLPPLPSDNMKALQDALNAKAERMRNGTDGRPVAMPRNVPPQISAARLPPSPVALHPPALSAEQWRTIAASIAASPNDRGVGTPNLAPATKVKTVQVDSLGRPVTPKSALQAATEAKAARIASGAETFTPTVPTIQPPRAATVRPPNSGWVPAVTAGTQAAGTVQLPAGVRPKAVDDAFRQIETAKAAPPVMPRAKPNFPVTAQNNLYAAAPPPVPAPLPSDPRLPKGDPDWYSPAAIKRADDIAMALYPKPSNSAVSAINAATLPRLPMMPSTAMSAARLPQIAPPTPRAPARIPLTQMGTVNPMTQIVPAVQARAGQTLFGRLFNNVTSGVVPQANTTLPGAPVNRPAWQNNPNVQRDDKWAGVLDNFGMII